MAQIEASSRRSQNHKRSLLDLKSALATLDHDILLHTKKGLALDEIDVLVKQLDWKLADAAKHSLARQLMTHHIDESQLGMLTRAYPRIVRDIVSCSPLATGQSASPSEEARIEDLLDKLLVLKNAYHRLQAKMHHSSQQQTGTQLLEVKNGMMLDKLAEAHRQIQGLHDTSRKDRKIWDNIVARSRQEATALRKSPTVADDARLNLDIIDHFVDEQWIESLKFYLRNWDAEAGLATGVHGDSIGHDTQLSHTEASLYEFSYMADQADNLFALDR